MTDWIDHDGKGMPKGLRNEADVVVKFRNGSKSPAMAAFAHHWRHWSVSSDIMSYRIHQPSPSKAGEA